jgi:septum formation protein
MFSSDAGIVLASSSRYRRALLDQIGLAFVACPAEIDEAPRAGEAPIATATRLASAKARAVAPKFPEAVIIGSDQVASFDGIAAFSKPGGHAEAVGQLTQMSGRTVQFHTAVCVLNARSGTERARLVSTEVQFRTLTPNVIEAYLHKDRPYDCAGSARIESLGIALVERVTSDDPSALLGLPLIALIDLLAAEGIRPI